MAESDIHVALVDLASVIASEDGNMRFLHASLPDFLFDQTLHRCGGIFHSLFNCMVRKHRGWTVHAPR